jgi:hypothetical protein
MGFLKRDDGDQQDAPAEVAVAAEAAPAPPAAAPHADSY